MHPATTVDDRAPSEHAPNLVLPWTLTKLAWRMSFRSDGPPCNLVAEIKADLCVLVAKRHGRRSP